MTQTPTDIHPAWQAPDAMTDHSGAAIPRDALFPEPPPAEIGTVTSAETTLSTIKKPRSAAVRAIIAILVAAPGIALTVLGLTSDVSGLVIWGPILALVGGVIAFFASASRRRCSYIGDRGIIRYTLKNNAPPRVERLLFDQATELRNSITHNYHNGIYSGTNYNFTWTGPDGKKVLTLSGSHRAKNKSPKRLDSFHFAKAAEIQWSQFLLDRAADELAETGAVTFHISKGKTVRLSPGFIEFDWSGKVDRLEAAAIAQIALSQGSFTIKSKDARWFSSKGKFSFPYSQMPNARVFLLAVVRFLPDVPKSF